MVSDGQSKKKRPLITRTRTSATAGYRKKGRKELKSSSTKSEKRKRPRKKSASLKRKTKRLLLEAVAALETELAQKRSNKKIPNWTFPQPQPPTVNAPFFRSNYFPQLNAPVANPAMGPPGYSHMYRGGYDLTPRHQYYNSYQKNGLPTHRRWSHLDDVYRPNYEDTTPEQRFSDERNAPNNCQKPYSRSSGWFKKSSRQTHRNNNRTVSMDTNSSEASNTSDSGSGDGRTKTPSPLPENKVFKKDQQVTALDKNVTGSGAQNCDKPGEKISGRDEVLKSAPKNTESDSNRVSSVSCDKPENEKRHNLETDIESAEKTEAESSGQESSDDSEGTPASRDNDHQSSFESCSNNICDDSFADFITIDSIDTNKSYLPANPKYLSSVFDDHRVIDMDISPLKRKGDDNLTKTSKKVKYDDLYYEINSQELLKEISKVLEEDKQSCKETRPGIKKRVRSRSLCLNHEILDAEPLKKSPSMNSIEKTKSETLLHYDLKTTLLELLNEQNPKEVDVTTGLNQFLREVANSRTDDVIDIIEISSGEDDDSNDIDKSHEKENGEASCKTEDNCEAFDIESKKATVERNLSDDESEEGSQSEVRNETESKIDNKRRCSTENDNYVKRQCLEVTENEDDKTCVVAKQNDLLVDNDRLLTENPLDIEIPGCVEDEQNIPNEDFGVDQPDESSHRDVNLTKPESSRSISDIEKELKLLLNIKDSDQDDMNTCSENPVGSQDELAKNSNVITEAMESEETILETLVGTGTYDNKIPNTEKHNLEDIVTLTSAGQKSCKTDDMNLMNTEESIEQNENCEQSTLKCTIMEDGLRMKQLSLLPGNTTNNGGVKKVYDKDMGVGDTDESEPIEKSKCFITTNGNHKVDTKCIGSSVKRVKKFQADSFSKTSTGEMKRTSAVRLKQSEGRKQDKIGDCRNSVSSKRHGMDSEHRSKPAPSRSTSVDDSMKTRRESVETRRVSSYQEIFQRIKVLFGSDSDSEEDTRNCVNYKQRNKQMRLERTSSQRKSFHSEESTSYEKRFSKIKMASQSENPSDEEIGIKAKHSEKRRRESVEPSTETVCGKVVTNEKNGSDGGPHDSKVVCIINCELKDPRTYYKRKYSKIGERVSKNFVKPIKFEKPEKLNQLPKKETTRSDNSSNKLSHGVRSEQSKNGKEGIQNGKNVTVNSANSCKSALETEHRIQKQKRLTVGSDTSKLQNQIVDGDGSSEKPIQQENSNDPMETSKLVIEKSTDDSSKSQSKENSQPLGKESDESSKLNGKDFGNTKSCQVTEEKEIISTQKENTKVAIRKQIDNFFKPSTETSSKLQRRGENMTRENSQLLEKPSIASSKLQKNDKSCQETNGNKGLTEENPRNGPENSKLAAKKSIEYSSKLPIEILGSENIQRTDKQNNDSSKLQRDNSNDQKSCQEMEGRERIHNRIEKSSINQNKSDKPTAKKHHDSHTSENSFKLHSNEKNTEETNLHSEKPNQDSSKVIKQEFDSYCHKTEEKKLDVGKNNHIADDINRDKTNPLREIRIAPKEKSATNSETVKGKNNNFVPLELRLVLTRIDKIFPSLITSEVGKFSAPTIRADVEAELKFAYQKLEATRLFQCSPLPKHPFPWLRRAVSCIQENDCCDRAFVLDSPEVCKGDRNQRHTGLEDDIIEIRKEIPVIDLTKQCFKENTSKTDEAKTVKFGETRLHSNVQDPPEKQEMITLYRSDETVNNSLDVQVTSESISPTVLRNKKRQSEDTIKENQTPIVRDKISFYGIVNINQINPTFYSTPLGGNKTNGTCEAISQGSTFTPANINNIAIATTTNNTSSTASLVLPPNPAENHLPFTPRQGPRPSDGNINPVNLSTPSVNGGWVNLTPGNQQPRMGPEITATSFQQQNVMQSSVPTSPLVDLRRRIDSIIVKINTSSAPANGNGIRVPMRNMAEESPALTHQISWADIQKTSVILTRYLYILNGMKVAQCAYVSELQKMLVLVPQITRTQMFHFERYSLDKYDKLCKDMVLELRNASHAKKCSSVTCTRMLMDEVFKQSSGLIKTLPTTRMYVMLEFLMTSEAKQYLEVPFLRDLYAYVVFIVNRMRHTAQLQGQTEVAAPGRDYFSPRQRSHLEWQIRQYSLICSKQKVLLEREQQYTTLRNLLNSTTQPINYSSGIANGQNTRQQPLPSHSNGPLAGRAKESLTTPTNPQNTINRPVNVPNSNPIAQISCNTLNRNNVYSSASNYVPESAVQISPCISSQHMNSSDIRASVNSSHSASAVNSTNILPSAIPPTPVTAARNPQSAVPSTRAPINPPKSSADVLPSAVPPTPVTTVITPQVNTPSAETSINPPKDEEPANSSISRNAAGPSTGNCESDIAIKEEVNTDVDKNAADVKPVILKEEVVSLLSEEMETIDLTWIDDIDPNQLKTDIEFVTIKKEDLMDEEEDNVNEEQFDMVLSPADSGFASPPRPVEYDEIVFSDRFCICGRKAEYVCECMLVMYCSVKCQTEDWDFHQGVCRGKSKNDSNEKITG